MAQVLKNTFSHPVKVRGEEVAPGESVSVDKASPSERLMFGLDKPKSATSAKAAAKKLTAEEAAKMEEEARKQAEEEQKQAAAAEDKARAEANSVLPTATEPAATTATAAKSSK